MRLLLLLLCLWCTPLHAEDPPNPMDLSYMELDEARESLRWRLDALQHRSRGVLLPPEDARRITRAMAQGYFLLRHPPLRAAFRSLEEITQEQDKLKTLNRRLDNVEPLLDADN